MMAVRLEIASSWHQIAEALWSPAVAADGNRTQMRIARQSRLFELAERWPISSVAESVQSGAFGNEFR